MAHEPEEEDEEDVEVEAFVMPRGTDRDKAVGLANELVRRLDLDDNLDGEPQGKARSIKTITLDSIASLRDARTDGDDNFRLVVVGENGEGKSVLCNILIGFGAVLPKFYEERAGRGGSGVLDCEALHVVRRMVRQELPTLDQMDIEHFEKCFQTAVKERIVTRELSDPTEDEVTQEEAACRKFANVRTGGINFDMPDYVLPCGSEVRVCQTSTSNQK